MENEKLTGKEKEIVKLIRDGKSYKKIEDILKIKESTLNTHISHIHLKTHTHSIGELILWALKNPDEL